MITQQQFARAVGCAPSIAATWYQPFIDAIARWGVTNVAMLLAQVGHESAGLTRVEENLNYTAQRLMQVWPRRFPSIESAHYYEHAPERLANLVYASRMGNGAYESGDGWRFHGRGPIQLTGANTYRRAAIALNLPLVEQPELLLQPGPGAASAVWFFKDCGADGLDVDGATQRINGGQLGLDDRAARYAAAVTALATT